MVKSLKKYNVVDVKPKTDPARKAALVLLSIYLASKKTEKEDPIIKIRSVILEAKYKLPDKI